MGRSTSQLSVRTVTRFRDRQRSTNREYFDHGAASASQSAAMQLDPNTHAFVLATAFFTSITFMIFALNLLALILQRVLG